MSNIPVRFIIIRTITNALIMGAVLYGVLAFSPVFREELSYWWRTKQGVDYVLEEEASLEAISKEGDENLAQSETKIKNTDYFSQKREDVVKKTISITPTSRAFGLIIEKIGVNVPVVKDVDSIDEGAYSEALRRGVAHAKGSSYPGEGGNVYIHGHSSLGYWQLGEYATVFTLLSKLDIGDRVVIFYEGERFDYQVSSKEIFPGYDTTPLLRDYDESVLTLQTCDPPGTTLNRLIVTARLVN